ncbi:transmembrane protein 180-like [Haliotis rufescens]|uniref:transmembrane protein 180-like n=1 Tax=Haliotis rufescens TaxID=6454 RepID=UPI001EAFC4AD|nr:transmembrane protein 180-like [Haliotis rufescens]XP_046380265.1 transmembrane protein 180-like [Haliotis rufescens]XP_046380266.1 transmembrane protein 180-like [Haliotis rufescens]
MIVKSSVTLLRRTVMGIQLPPDICYGSMAFFMSILHNIFLLYHVDMFVSVYKIDKYSFWVGEAIFLVWNSLNDPLFGWLSDRQYLNTSAKTSSQYEIVMRRFNAIQINGPLFAISFIAFWIPWAYPWLQFVVCLCLYDGFLTMLDLHHSALLADLSVSADVRTSLNSRCSIFSAMGSASVFLSYAFWNKDNLSSFRTFCFILACVSFVGFLLSSSLLKNYYIKKHKEEDEEVTSKETKDLDLPGGAPTKSFISQLLSQKNFLWFAAMNLIQVFHCHFNSNFFPLFLENLLGDAISPSTGSFLIGISFVAPHINNLYFLQLCRRFGVYSVINFLFVVKLTLSIIMLVVGPSQIWLLCIYIASNRVFTEGTCRLLNLVISDLVDEDYVIHSRRQPVAALMFGTAALVSKPGQTLAPLIGTWILSLQTGHDIFQSGNEAGSIKLSYHDMDTGTRALHRQGCFQLLVYVPIICAASQLLVWTQFSLHGRRLAQIKSLREGGYSGSHV